MSNFVMVCNMDEYILYTRSIFINDLLRNGGPASENDSPVYALSMPIASASCICDITY